MKLIKVPREAVPQHPSFGASCNNHFHLAQSLTEWLRTERSLQVIQPSLTLRQGSLEHLPQDCVQMDLGYPQGMRLHSLSGQPAPVLRSPSQESSTPFLVEFPVHQFLPIASHPVTEHYQ